MKQRILLSLFLGLTLHLYAQHPVFYTIDVDKGLPSNEVYQLVQDAFGYIWVGSDAGLYRYDGFVFKPYKSRNQNSRSVSSLQLDKKGRVWCRNFTGQILRVEGDSLIVVKDLSKKPLANNQFTLDEKSTVWFFEDSLLMNASDKGVVIKRLLLPKRSQIITPQYISFYKEKIFLSLKNSDSYSLDVTSGVFEKLKTDRTDFKTRLNSFFIWKDTLRMLSVMTQSRSFLISSIQGDSIRSEHEYFSTNQNSRVHELMADAEGTLWVCTSNGTFPYSTNFSYLHEHKGYFKSLKVSYVLKDREGLYWVSTLQNGILVSPSLETKIWNSENSTLSEDNLTSLGQHNGNLILGSYTGRLSALDSSQANLYSLEQGEDVPTLNTKRIVSSGPDLFVAHGPLTEIRKNGSIQHYAPHNIRDFVLVRDSIFYVYPDYAAKASLNDLRQGRVGASKQLRSVGGRSIAYVSAEDGFYFTFHDGLYYYHKGVWKEITYNKTSIHAMALSATPTAVWVAALLNGVLKIENGNVMQVFDQLHGLMENDIKCIKASNDKVWASNGSHLYSISTTTHEIAFYTASIGFNPSDINAIEMIGDQVYFATNKGLVQMPNSLEWKNTVTPNSSIESVMLNGENLNPNQPIVIPHTHTNFRINFSATAFRSMGHFFYEYRLVGFDEVWQKREASSAYVLYSSLPPGEYSFEVRAVNESQVHGNSQVINFKVTPPAWQTWWFYAFMSFLSIAVVVIIYSFRIRYLRQQAEISNRLTASQLTALKAQMNPHFMYNALNSIQDLVMNKDVKNSNLYLSKFSTLMRNVLNASGAEEISLQDEIEILSLYLELEKLRFGDEFKYEIIVATELNTNDLSIPPMILQPFVENAMKHGLLHRRGEKKLAIEFQLSNSLQCIITDNGVGRKRSTEIKNRLNEKHASFATQATEKRIELLTHHVDKKFKLTITDLQENGQASGTQVSILIPLRDS